jgi:glycerophosphoryl diester phosphodiesterase
MDERVGERPMVIGHRGASGYRPEHTLAAYRLAIEQGADAIEPDLVPTRDGVLVARHESELGRSTDVAARPEFAARRAAKTIDGAALTGWFVEDFTLAELQTLRAREPLPELRPDSAALDGRYAIPTLQEVLELARASGVAVFPETKHAGYFARIGLAPEEPLVAALEAAGLRGPDAPVAVQSFEPAHLVRLRRLTGVALVQLLAPRGHADLAAPAGLAAIAEYAQAVGAHKSLIVPRDAANRLRPPTRLVADAHAAGLVVQGWTFRRENAFLPEDFRRGDPASADYLRLPGDLAAEVRLFAGLGVDRVLSDHPDVAVAA